MATTALELTIDVQDATRLRRHAELRHRARWGDASWERLLIQHGGDVPLGVLAYEAMIACAPDAAALGVQVMDVWTS